MKPKYSSLLSLLSVWLVQIGMTSGLSFAATDNLFEKIYLNTTFTYSQSYTDSLVTNAQGAQELSTSETFSMQGVIPLKYTGELDHLTSATPVNLSIGEFSHHATLGESVDWAPGRNKATFYFNDPDKPSSTKPGTIVYSWDETFLYISAQGQQNTGGRIVSLGEFQSETLAGDVTGQIGFGASTGSAVMPYAGKLTISLPTNSPAILKKASVSGGLRFFANFTAPTLSVIGPTDNSTIIGTAGSTVSPPVMVRARSNGESVSVLLPAVQNADEIPLTRDEVDPQLWAGEVSLQPGTNILWVIARRGSAVTAKEVKVNYTVPTTLTVILDPPSGGTVTSGFLGSSSRNVGTSVSIKATANTGFVFAGWSGLDLGAPDQITAQNESLTTTVRPSMALTAHFVPNPFAKFAGAYQGNVQPTQVDGAASSMIGGLGVTVNSNGQFTGRFTHSGVMIPFAGRFIPSTSGNQLTQAAFVVGDAAAGGEYPANVVVDTLDPMLKVLRLNLVLTTNAGTPSILGTVSTYDGTNLSLAEGDYGTTVAYRNVFTASAPVAEHLAGIHTVIMDDGSRRLAVASVKITTLGVVTIAGQLHDASSVTAFTSSANVANYDPNSVRFYAGLFSGSKRGSLAGEIRPLPEDPESAYGDHDGPSIEGEASVCIEELRTDPSAPVAILDTMALRIAGRHYMPPAAGQRMLPELTASNGAATFAATDSKLSATLRMLVSTSNVVTFPIPGSLKPTVTLIPSTGLLTGTMMRTATSGASSRVNFYGVALPVPDPGQPLFWGFYVDSREPSGFAGEITITPDLTPASLAVAVSTPGFDVTLAAPTKLEDLLVSTWRNSQDAAPFLVAPYDPTSVQPPATPVSLTIPAGRSQFGSFEGYFLAADAKTPAAWNTPPQTDDARLIARYAPTTKSQTGNAITVPGDNGTGSMDQGWTGDNQSKLPGSVTYNLPPDSSDMIFDTTTAPSAPGEQVAPTSQLSIDRSLRFLLNWRTNSITLEKVIDTQVGSEASKPTPLCSPPPLPGDGGYVLVVRSSTLDAKQVPGKVYHINLINDPFSDRSYSPPTGGSHATTTEAQTYMRLRIPILSALTQVDINTLTVQIYRLSKPSAFSARSLLTSDLFVRNETAFTKIKEWTGSAISQMQASQTQSTAPPPVGTSNVSTVHRSGGNNDKFNLTVIGDGFSSSDTDQTAFKNYVDNVIMDVFHTRDAGPEILNAVNVFRIDTTSQDSGVTLVNSSGAVTTSRNTSLEYRFSASWQRCWMEPGPNSNTIVNNLISTLAPQTDQVIIVLNTPGFGGCARGNSLAVTLGANWTVFAHELGHMFGQQGDEYQCNSGSGTCGAYSGAEPGAINLTINTSRSSVDWSEWIPSWRPVPTSSSQVSDLSQDVGIFAGGTLGSGQWWTGIYRPSFRGRMNDNSPPHNPVGYTSVRDRARTYQEATFRKNAVGDFNGDGRSDIVFLDGRQLALHLAADRSLGANDPVLAAPTRSASGVLNPTWYWTDKVVNSGTATSWQIRSGDILIPADFDGDGKADLFIVNQTNWSINYLVMMKSFGDHFEPVARYDGNLPGWQMRSGDEFYAGDIDGDGRQDLMVYNGKNWSIPYFGMMRSTGSSLQYVRRYDHFLPTWEMGKNEKFTVADYDGDGRADVIAFNTADWAQVHLQVQLSTGAGLTLKDRYYGTIPGLWQLRRNDKIYALDFNGDKSKDLAIFNGLDWGPTYLGLLVSNGGKLNPVRRYDNGSPENSLPGWQLQRRDTFWVSDVNGDKKEDLVVFNKNNWSTEYLGILKSDGVSQLTGSWQSDWIGGWNLSPPDDFKVADFKGGSGWVDLFVFNDNWFGMLRSFSSQFALEAVYPKWIHNHRYHKYGWW